MTESTEDKPKKLTFGGGKLSLNIPIDPIKNVKTFVSSKSNTIVEVKKSKLSATGLNFNVNNPYPRNDHDQTEELSKRLNILKKAAEDARLRENDINKITPLSRLAAINQQNMLDENAAKLARKTLDEEKAQESTINEITPVKAEIKGPLLPQNRSFDEEEEFIAKKKLTDAKNTVVKTKLEEPKKLKKVDLLQMLDQDGTDGVIKTRSLASIKRAKEKEKRKFEQPKQEKVFREVTIPEFITVSDLSNRMSERASDVIRELMKLGIMASSNQTIDADTAEIIVAIFGHTAKRIQESDIENILINEDTPDVLRTRPPIVTVMGHVDHGKTSLLDALKSTDIVSTEAGGITQHIGAYKVTLKDGRSITFIDTPGHEAFTEMRTRGAKVTDIVILVVAADDGIKTQTIEAINHAKAAAVPIIVAINKIDKADTNIEKVKNELLMHELIAEDLGGDTIIVPVSAMKKMNLDKLEEAILLVAEMQDLKTNYECVASGIIIEARIDKGKGVIATVLIERGTLKNGDIIVAGATHGKVKRMINDKGLNVFSAGPSDPIEIYGLTHPPHAGDHFNVVTYEKQARDIAEYRERLAKDKKVSINKRSSLEDLFLKASGNSNIKELSLIIKCDVHGSIEAITGSLQKLPNDEIKLKVLHSGVGGITESDVALANASKAIIIGFNVRANNSATMLAEREKIEIKYYSIIYDLINDIKAIMSGMLAPIIREKYIGSVEIRMVFNVTKIGKVAGSYVTKGMIKRGAGVRLLRDNIVIYEGKLKTLRRFKDDVKEVREGFECGIAFENYEDIKIGDIVEVFEIFEEKKQLM